MKKTWRHGEGAGHSLRSSTYLAARRGRRLQPQELKLLGGTARTPGTASRAQLTWRHGEFYLCLSRVTSVCACRSLPHSRRPDERHLRVAGRGFCSFSLVNYTRDTICKRNKTPIREISSFSPHSPPRFFPHRILTPPHGAGALLLPPDCGRRTRVADAGTDASVIERLHPGVGSRLRVCRGLGLDVAVPGVGAGESQPS